MEQFFLSLDLFLLLVLPESILSMDIPSTGPTSLRSNCTDEDDKEDLDDESSSETPTPNAPGSKMPMSKQERFAALVTQEELSSATLLTMDS